MSDQIVELGEQKIRLTFYAVGEDGSFQSRSVFVGGANQPDWRELALGGWIVEEQFARIRKMAELRERRTEIDQPGFEAFKRSLGVEEAPAKQSRSKKKVKSNG